MTTPPTTPLPQPGVSVGVSADIVVSGQLIPPIDRIKIFSNVQWEEFILEWADSFRSEYSRVERCGGAGDMGRDIIATCKNDSNRWDNYQCKHYRNGLAPTDIWVELGKLVYYTHRGDYTYPRKYYFVSPLGAGTTLSNLLKKPERLRAELIANWDKYCRGEITSTKPVELDTTLRDYISGLDFTIFEAVPPLGIIDQHAKTRWHVARFGGGLPPRPPHPALPKEPTEQEARYVRQLLDAYGDHLKYPILAVGDLADKTDLQEHFQDSRLEFYSAESLRGFSRDTLPPGEFEKLQVEVHSGIKDEIRLNHLDGYGRVTAVTKTARALQLSGHALSSRLTVMDRGGVCHQLANDEKVRWVR